MRVGIYVGIALCRLLQQSKIFVGMSFPYDGKYEIVAR